MSLCIRMGGLVWMRGPNPRPLSASCGSSVGREHWPGRYPQIKDRLAAASFPGLLGSCWFWKRKAWFGSPLATCRAKYAWTRTQHAFFRQLGRRGVQLALAPVLSLASWAKSKVSAPCPLPWKRSPPPVMRRPPNRRMALQHTEPDGRTLWPATHVSDGQLPALCCRCLWASTLTARPFSFSWRHLLCQLVHFAVTNLSSPGLSGVWLLLFNLIVNKKSISTRTVLPAAWKATE